MDTTNSVTVTADQTIDSVLSSTSGSGTQTGKVSMAVTVP
jgi:hypothetical protein